MSFSEQVLKNKALHDSIFTFNKFGLGDKGIPPEAGAHVLENGDVEIKIFAPEAKTVRIEAWADSLSLVKRGDGMFEGVLGFKANATGPRTLDIYIDGTLVLIPYIPLYWTANRPCNFIEMPDEDIDYFLIKDVPHGMMLHTIYPSKVTGDWERCVVYTPPGYMTGNERYPVLYLNNGGGDNETSWEYSGRLPYIMDNLIASGEAVPFIIVMINTMLRANGNIAIFRDRDYEKLLVEDCIPFIEKNFRVKTGKWNRAIAGLSMGAYLTCDIGFWHPETFGNMGTFTASMTTQDEYESYARPYPEVISNAKTFGEKYKVYFRSTTPLENHFDWFEADDRLCKEYGIDKLPCYHRVVYSDTTSKWNSWRKGLRDFAKLLFKE